MAGIELSDEQWCLLDLLVRARRRGIDRVSRLEILASESLPAAARMRLVFAGLTMPEGLVVWHGKHVIALSEKGAALYDLEFGRRAPGSDRVSPAEPTAVADDVIRLPGPEGYRH